MASSLTRPQRVALKTWSPANLKSLWDAYLKKNPGAQLPGTGMAPNIGGFSPFAAPERPPPGTYDPSIDAQVAASGRGFGDLQQDTDIGNTRAQDDFLTGKGELQRQLDRTLADAATAKADITHNYGVLGDRQGQQANASGIVRGGALQQALEKRTANMAHDIAPIDVGVQRAQDDFGTHLAELGLGLSRGNEDRANTLARGGRENTQLGLDAAGQRWYQASALGIDPGTRPASQHGSEANPYKVVKTPRGTRRLYHTGYLVSR